MWGCANNLNLWLKRTQARIAKLLRATEPSQPLCDICFLKRIPDKKEALKNALEIRKFEIDLYWKRAAYFWTFIGAAFVAFGTLHLSIEAPREKTEEAIEAVRVKNERASNLAFLISCLGVVSSIGWYLVNKGSKKWQENWEKNVEILESATVTKEGVNGELSYEYQLGILFGTVWDKKPEGLDKARHMLGGSGRWSGTGINHIISLFVTFLWIFLLCSLWYDRYDAEDDWDFTCIVGVSLAAVACLLFVAVRPEGQSYWHAKNSAECGCEQDAVS